MLFRNNSFSPNGYYPNVVNYGLSKPGRDWGALLNNAQKTLGIVNQAIPIINQVRPILKNAGTMFKVVNEFRKINNSDSASVSTVSDTKKEEPSNSPNFFI